MDVLPYPTTTDFLCRSFSVLRRDKTWLVRLGFVGNTPLVVAG